MAAFCTPLQRLAISFCAHLTDDALLTVRAPTTGLTVICGYEGGRDSTQLTLPSLCVQVAECCMNLRDVYLRVREVEVRIQTMPCGHAPDMTSRSMLLGLFSNHVRGRSEITGSFNTGPSMTPYDGGQIHECMIACR